MEYIETLIIGGGQAGLTISHALTRHGRPHLVLERGRVAERWRSERWDGLHFQTPNALVNLPDFPFPTTAPDGFATAARIADFIESYAAHIHAPLRTGTAVTSLRRQNAGTFLAETTAGRITAANVVVATGPFQRPVIPALLPETPGIVQLHASAYKAPAQLPPGGVLVVGAGASGAQIAEELQRAGRRVFFSVSRHRRAPRRYRGQDHVWWWLETGMDQTPAAKRGPDKSPLVHSGAYGGRTIDFRDFAANGMILLGRAEAARDRVMAFAGDLPGNIALGDAPYLAFIDFVDDHVRRAGLNVPEDPAARMVPPIPPDFQNAPRRLDLLAEGITTVIWATGYGLDFRWIDIPVFDPRGAPVHEGGITAVPGLYFLGLHFLSRLSSSFLFGVGDDSARLARHIAAR